jgi:hypothetical protein
MPQLENKIPISSSETFDAKSAGASNPHPNLN